MARRLALVLLLVIGGLFGVAGRAAACSCAPSDPRDTLERSDGAFVGTLTDRSGGPLDPTNTFRFAVELVLKGEIRAQVDVAASGNGASCGLEVAEGERVGLFLTGREGNWSSSLCSQIDPQVLVQTAGGLPALTGTGPLRFLLTGSLGEANLVALDPAGQTLGFGFGARAPTSLSVCPGSIRAVAIVPGRADGLHLLEVVDLGTLRVIRSTQVSDRASDVRDVQCRDVSGDEALVLVDWWRFESGYTSVLRIRPDAVSEAVTVPVTFSVGELRSDRVDVVDLTHPMLYRAGFDGASPLEASPLPAMTWVASVSPDGSKAAGVVFDPGAEGNDPPSYLYVIDLERGSAPLARIDLPKPSSAGWVVWADDGTVVFFPSDGPNVQVFDASLGPIGNVVGWDAGRGVIADGSAYGTRQSGAVTELIAAELPAGPVRILGSFDSPELQDVAFVPGHQQVAFGKTPPVPAAPTATGDSRTWLWIGIGALIVLGLGALTAARVRGR